MKIMDFIHNYFSVGCKILATGILMVHLHYIIVCRGKKYTVDGSSLLFKDDLDKRKRN